MLVKTVAIVFLTGFFVVTPQLSAWAEQGTPPPAIQAIPQAEAAYFTSLGDDYESLGANIMVSVHHSIQVQGNNHLFKEAKNHIYKEPVAEALNACIGKYASTIEMDTCLDEAYKAYTIILNKVYQLALLKNDKNTQHALQDSQKKWLAFRQSEEKAQGIYNRAGRRGSVMGPAIGYQDIHAIRERIAEIMFYLGTDQG